MDISITSNVLSSVQATNATLTAKKADNTEQTSTEQLTSGDVVEISDEAKNRLLAVQAGTETESSSQEYGSPTSAPAANSASSAGTTSEDSTSSDDTSVSEIRAQISALQQEIAALQTQDEAGAATAGQIALKEAELAALKAELMQMQVA